MKSKKKQKFINIIFIKMCKIFLMFKTKLFYQKLKRDHDFAEAIRKFSK